MRRVRNAVVILILCIIGGYSLMKKTGPTLSMPAGDELRDSMRGNPTRASRPGLNFGQTNDGELRDAVANNAAETGGNGSPFGSSEGGVGAPPRGSGNGGFGPAGNNVGNEFPPNTPPPGNVSPSGPPSEEQPYCPSRSQECYYPE